MEGIHCEAYEKMSAWIYVVTDLDGNFVYKGTCGEIRKKFGVKGSMYGYCHGSLLKGKYVVEHYKPERKSTNRLTPYQELLKAQMLAFNTIQNGQFVYGYQKDIEKNIRDLKEAGIKVEKVECVYREKRRRREWKLKKV